MNNLSFLQKKKREENISLFYLHTSDNNLIALNRYHEIIYRELSLLNEEEKILRKVTAKI